MWVRTVRKAFHFVLHSPAKQLGRHDSLIIYSLDEIWTPFLSVRLRVDKNGKGKERDAAG